MDETTAFIERALNTRPKFMKFLLYWILEYCGKHNVTLIEFITEFLINIKNINDEQQQKPVELNTTKSTEEI